APAGDRVDGVSPRWADGRVRVGNIAVRERAAAVRHVSRVVSHPRWHDEGNCGNPRESVEHLRNVTIRRDATAVVDDGEVDAAVRARARPASGGGILTPAHPVR